MPGKTLLQNDLLCVQWDVKLYSFTHFTDWMSLFFVVFSSNFTNFKSFDSASSREYHSNERIGNSRLRVKKVDNVALLNKSSQNYLPSMKCIAVPLAFMFHFSVMYFTCHLTQVNTLHHYTSQTGW